MAVMKEGGRPAPPRQVCECGGPVLLQAVGRTLPSGTDVGRNAWSSRETDAPSARAQRNNRSALDNDAKIPEKASPDEKGRPGHTCPLRRQWLPVAGLCIGPSRACTICSFEGRSNRHEALGGGVRPATSTPSTKRVGEAQGPSISSTVAWEPVLDRLSRKVARTRSTRGHPGRYRSWMRGCPRGCGLLPPLMMGCSSGMTDVPFHGATESIADGNRRSVSRSRDTVTKPIADCRAAADTDTRPERASGTASAHFSVARGPGPRSYRSRGSDTARSFGEGFHPATVAHPRGRLPERRRPPA